MKAPLVLLTALFIASAHQTLSGETSGDWTYSVLDNQATITGYSGGGGGGGGGNYRGGGGGGNYRGGR